ncbi:MAG: glycerol-3-phosphate acyltransferase [Clostridia bacterium]|nr:glycerol-3-phosphate acyltransferase [Clostridia bacterium]
MKSFILLCACTAVIAYLCGGLNPAIIFSKAVYHKDIREYGSKNPGFTNFKRVFGPKLAWFVFLCDVLKTLIPVLAASFLFSGMITDLGADSTLMWKFGAAFAGIFVMLGHAFPVWYAFKGGKTFSCGAALVWFIDWRAGLVSAAIFLFLLLVVPKIMSLSSCSAALTFPIATLTIGLITGVIGQPFYIAVVALNFAGAALLIARHHSNLSRLFRGEEKKFYLFGRPKEKAEPAEEIQSKN